MVVQIRLVSMKMRGQSLASPNGSGIWHCYGCGVDQQQQLRFDPLALELPYALGVALKSKKKFELKIKNKCLW